jgi:hypothetical protein
MSRWKILATLTTYSFTHLRKWNNNDKIFLLLFVMIVLGLPNDFKHSPLLLLFITKLESFFQFCENRWNMFPCKISITFWREKWLGGLNLLRVQPPSHYFNHRNNKMLIHQSTSYNIHYFLGFARPRIIIISHFKLKTFG